MQRSASAIPNTVLWGGAASALLGATLAEWQRRREEEAARLAAMRNSRGGGGDEEEEQGNGRKSAGQIAYEKKQQQKRIVAESQALMNHGKAQEQTQNAAVKNKNLTAAEAEMDKVNPVTPYVAASYIDKDEEKRLKGQESQRAWAAVNAREEQKSGGKSLAMPAQDDDPPPSPIVNIFPEWLRVLTTQINNKLIQPVKDASAQTSITVKEFMINTGIAVQNTYLHAEKALVSSFSKGILGVWDLINPNARGEDLVEVSEDEILCSPEIALRKTYIAAAINVQRDGLNLTRDGYTSGKGPAQLSQQQLDTPYGEPYYFDDCEEIKAKCIAGYGVGVDGSPYDPNVAVEGMTNRIEQVLKYAENQAEKNDVTLDETDRFIITALSQNGSGFDQNDVLLVLKEYPADGKIDWKGYFEDEYEAWPGKKPWVERKILETWQWIKTGKGGKDFDTEFSLELYYQEMRALESQGYPFPEGLDIQKIEDLMNTSEQARQEEE